MAEIKNIVVLYGGSSSEREVSLKSGKGINHSLLEIGLESSLKDFSDIKNLQSLAEYDLVFIALNGFEGESGRLQKELDNLNIRYTGSSSIACMNTWNKSSFKKILEENAISTPRGFSVERLDASMESPFAIFYNKHNTAIEKMFLKPVEDGSSIDIFEINSDNDLTNSINKSINPDRPFIFEEAIKNREFTVTILNNQCLPILEIITQNSFYDYDAKYISNDTQLLEADLCKEDKERINDLSLRAYKETGCSGWGRVDILQDTDEQFYILEINTVPGMTSHSCVPRSAALAGFSYNDLVEQIIKDAAK